MFKRPPSEKSRVYGWKAKQPKFSPEQAQEIREAHAKGISYRQISLLYSCDKNTALAVCRQKGAYSKYRQV